MKADTTTARTGDRCPETGVWAMSGHPKVTVTLEEGEQVPPWNDRPATWLLVENVWDISVEHGPRR